MAASSFLSVAPADESVSEDSDLEENYLDSGIVREESIRDPHKTYWRRVVAFLLVLMLLGTILNTCVVLKITSRPEASSKVELMEKNTAEVIKKEGYNAINLAITIGHRRTEILQVGIITVVAWVCVIICVITATLVTTLDPLLTPYDFEQKGTLSNVSQDVSKPHGRLFAVGLFTANMMLLFSMYPFVIYRPWAWKNFNQTIENPTLDYDLEYGPEQLLRVLWCVVPTVFFMFTAVTPSLSAPKGFDIALTAVHNVFAPTAMLFMVMMETIQLDYGENAFRTFWAHGDKATSVYGRLTYMQHMRVITVMIAWVAGVAFIVLQAYLFLAKNQRYSIALASYGAEVTGMVLAFTLPPMQSYELYTLRHEYFPGTVMQETAHWIELSKNGTLIGNPYFDWSLYT